MDDIQLCLGHTDPDPGKKVTRIYVAEDYKRADIANRANIDYLYKRISSRWVKKEKLVTVRSKRY